VIPSYPLLLSIETAHYDSYEEIHEEEGAYQDEKDKEEDPEELEVLLQRHLIYH
jgi:hypothetical protein